MKSTKTIKIIVLVGIMLGVIGIVTASVIPIMNNNKTVTLTLLYNAGIMIEYRGIRVYVDPIDLPDEYANLPADIILITHPHADHYEKESIELIQKQDTLVVFPNNMSEEIALHNGIGIDPKDHLLSNM